MLLALMNIVASKTIVSINWLYGMVDTQSIPLLACSSHSSQVVVLQSGHDCDQTGGQHGATHATPNAAVLQGSTVLQTFQHGRLVCCDKICHCVHSRKKACVTCAKLAL